jgi:hypothetical protein
MYVCILETECRFFEGVCAPSNATADFRDPPPLLDSRINPREPQSNATEHFNGQQHPKLGGIDASGAVRVREHSHEVAPKRRSVARPDQTCQLRARTTDV